MARNVLHHLPDDLASGDADLEHLLDDDQLPEDRLWPGIIPSTSTPGATPTRSSDLTQDDSIPPLVYSTESDSGNSSSVNDTNEEMAANQELVTQNSERNDLLLNIIFHDSNHVMFRTFSHLANSEGPTPEGTCDDSQRLDTINATHIHFINYLLSTLFINLFIINYSGTVVSNVFSSSLFDLKVE